MSRGFETSRGRRRFAIRRLKDAHDGAEALAEDRRAAHPSGGEGLRRLEDNTGGQSPLRLRHDFASDLSSSC